MSSASVGCSQPAPCPVRAPLRRCKNRGDKKNVVFIDVDNDSFDNVILIDVPESSKRACSKRTIPDPNVLRKDRKHQSPRMGVIYLDDDENTDYNFTNNGVKNDINLNSGASSSKRSHCKSGGLGKSPEAVGDDCQFVRENVRPVKLSKCKRTYSGKSSGRNHYGLPTDSESSPSDGDYTDCELVEDSFGRVKEQWEKASSRRKYDTRNGHSGIGDPNWIPNDSRRNVEGAKDFRQDKETLFEEKNGKEKETPPTSEENVNVGCSNNYGKPTCNEDDDYGLESILKTHFPPNKDDPHYSVNPFAEGPSCYTEFLNGSHFGQGASSSCREEQGPKGPSSFAHQEQNSCRVNHEGTDFQDIQRTPPEKDKGHDLVHGKVHEAMPNFEDVMISERERLKETDEYKRATEEEWASRKRSLQIQAEESQRLRRIRKREKAESMRLLDMERRQKQRVEEIRETQKKDVENLNLKEVLRSQVRRELQQLEVRCLDMTSLLRGLGIFVSNAANPPLNEVRAAYKRALLTFHPDRASRADIHQQVEAEEKFKLISRMKDKFLLPA